MKKNLFIRKGTAIALSVLMIFGSVSVSAYTYDDTADKNAVKNVVDVSEPEETISKSVEDETAEFMISVEEASPGRNDETTEESETVEETEESAEETPKVGEGKDAAEKNKPKNETEGLKTDEEDKSDTVSEDWIALSVEEVEELVGVKADNSADFRAASRMASSMRSSSRSTVTGSYIGKYDGGSVGSLRVNGSRLAFCILPWSKIPDGGSANFADYSITGKSDANLQLMAKIMYYGYGGGGNILGGYSAFDQESITHFALSYVWMINIGNSHGLADPWKTGGSSVGANGQATVINFINTVKGKPSVKGTLHIASYYEQSGRTYQDVAYGYFDVEEKIGRIRAKKVSANSAANGNACYSLEGIQFNVYTNIACTQRAKDINGNDIILTSGKDGITQTAAVKQGTYYVREVESSLKGKGWIYNPNPEAVTVTDANTSDAAVATVRNTPNMDPIGVILKKFDKETGEDVRRV